MAGEGTKPVWVWPSGAAQPVRCGAFTWREGLGEFSYEPGYVAAGAVPLDPVSLPLTRAKRPHRETKQNGLFGVLRDASPEGYGLVILQTMEGRDLDPIERFECALGDGVGDIEVCVDIQRKIDFQPTPLGDVLASLADQPEGVPASRVVRELHHIVGTSLGGERPKMTVSHAGQQWIAKLQDRGDRPNYPLREYLAMRSARAAGINAAEVEFHRAGRHQTVVVKRFDRLVQADLQVQRYGFASAHTLLQLPSDALRGDPARSYPYLASELQRWCGAAGVNVKEMKRELWRRMAFNAICGNADDHPRNHGVLRIDGRWSLSPAYDIAPYPTFGRTLAMSITRQGHMRAERWALLRDCDTFGYEEDEASAYIDQAITVMKETWDKERAALGFTELDAPMPQPQEWIEQAPPVDLKPKRRPRPRNRRDGEPARA